MADIFVESEDSVGAGASDLNVGFVEFIRFHFHDWLTGTEWVHKLEGGADGMAAFAKVNWMNSHEC